MDARIMAIIARQTVSSVALTSLLGALYFAAGRFGLSLAFVHPSASPIWPPSGLALSALLVFGDSLWPGIFLGAFFVNLTTSGSLPVSLAIASGNTAEALVGAALVRRYAGGIDAFSRVRDFVFFLAVIALVTTPLCATIGTLSLALGGLSPGSPLGPTWFNWWVGDTTGIILVAPALVLWASSPSIDRRYVLEAGALLLALCLTGLVLFSSLSPSAIARRPNAFFCIPVVCWAALRFESRGSASVTLLLSTMAILGTTKEYGPFAGGPYELILLPAFLAMIGIMGIVIGANVSERRRVEDALRREQELLTRIFDTIPVMITLYNPDTKLMRLNKEFQRVTGWSLEEISGVSLMDEFYPEPQYREQVRQFMEHGTGWMDVSMNVRSGRRIETSWANIRLSNQTQVGIGLDITDRKRAESLLIDADRRKDDFLAMLSHELRSPLSAVLNWLHLLRGGFLDSAKAANALEAIDRNTRLQVKLIEDLVDISRITEGKLTLEMAELDVRSVVERAVENIRDVAAKKPVALNCELGPQPLHLFGDSTRLQQVFDNLLSNAIKFTPPGGRIDVEVRRDGPEAVLLVRDTGQGIAARYIDKIFDRFAQVDGTITRRHQGLGLGLTIARHLVALHRGRIEAESGGENQGSTFRVWLPLADLALLASGTSRARPFAPNALKGLRVLVVDDDADNLDASSGVLTAAGARVAMASSVTEALARFNEDTFDVVLTDLAMPDRDGFALVRAIRQGEKTGEKKTPIIALTALSNFDQARTQTEGFDLRLVKPVSPPELVGAVASCVRSKNYARGACGLPSG
jgi:PAS domain S-box-containing protein